MQSEKQQARLFEAWISSIDNASWETESDESDLDEESDDDDEEESDEDVATDGDEV